MATQPPLGWISPANRNQDQADAHQRAVNSFHPRLHIAGPAPTGPLKVLLTDAWKNPLVVKDTGLTFSGFRQLTGACVGVSTGNAVFTLAAIQRLLSDNPTKAFVPWWPFDYGRCRYNEGDRGQGEGAVDSVMAQTLISEGTVALADAGSIPSFDTSDGLALTERQELTYSDGAYSGNVALLNVAKKFPLGGAAVLKSVADIKAAIINGYPVLDGCDNYIGNGTLTGTGSDVVALGHYDGRGGHSTCYLGYWDHPVQGPLYLYSNQWDGSTYPDDGSGKARCTVWVKEAEVSKLFQTGGGDGETVALSHLSYFPAQPAVVNDWIV